jgi:hypothetical protein
MVKQQYKPEYDYSDKEKALFSVFGYSDVLRLCISAPIIYRMCVEKAFIDNMQGKTVESLRRCYKALQSMSVIRLTEQWDEMIKLDD